MDYTRLQVYRHNLYHECFTRAADALFDVCDALLTDVVARSFVELSQAASFRRAWPSLYAALQDGQIDRAALLRLAIDLLPRRLVGTRLVLGLDTSSILRPEAHTASDRTLVYRSNLPSDATPVGPGWSFSTLVVLPEPVSSWTYILDNRRVPSSETASTIGVQQLQALLPRLPSVWGRPTLLLDRRYSTAPWVQGTAALPLSQLIRARRDQVLYRPPPPRSGKPGAPRKDGARFQGRDPTTHGAPDADWSGLDAQQRDVQVSCWQGLHLRKAREVTITVVRIMRTRARNTKRDPRESWFWWLGGPLPALEELAGLYGRRYGQEHGYRFDKQDLLWATPRVRTPAQMERWTDVVAAVHNQLVLAKPQVAGERRAWEARKRPVTPRHVRRAMGRIIAQLGTPARPPQARGKAPGRAVGAVVKRAERYAVVRKSPPKAKSPPKRG
ncbi:MAG TPA: transposase [Candidatus Binatia bacterium]|nr:transposase [Candidatus Binatia bacterium]